MAALYDGKTFRIFKFPETGLGLVALCLEVADFVYSGDARQYNVDLTTARYERDQWNGHAIVINYLPPEEES